MPGAMGVDVSEDRIATESHVSDEVKGFVAHEFVGRPELSVHDSGIAEDYGVVQ